MATKRVRRGAMRGRDRVARRPYVQPQVEIRCWCGAVHLDWFASGCRKCGRPLPKPKGRD